MTLTPGPFIPVLSDSRMTRLRRDAKIVGVVLLVFVLAWVTSLYLSESKQVSDLTAAARRQRPTADYIAAEFAHTDCRKNHEDVFLAAVSKAFDPDLTTEQRQVFARAASVEGAALARIEDLCPTPSPPVFDDDGRLVQPPVIPSTTSPSIAN